MKIFCLFSFLISVFISFSQDNPFVYFVPSEKDSIGIDFVYLLQDESNEIRLLKINNDLKYEYIVYSSDGNVLCDYYQGNYFNYKNFNLTTKIAKNYLIVKSDSLVFALDNFSAEKHSDQYIQLDIQSQLNGLIFKGGVFYKNKFDAFLKINPVLSPIQDSRFNFAWYRFPNTGKPLINGKCSAEDDLDCLCSALTYNAISDKEKSDRIAEFIINRFRYNRGDTSQQNIKGLVFGKEKEAVCEGYSRVYNDLMSRAKIPVRYVTGAVRDEVYNIFYSGFSHAWNEVILDGKPYVLDVTWSDDLYSKWYLKSPQEMFLSHFNTEKPDSSWQINMKKSMYDFMNQPYISNLEKGALEKIKFLDKTEPIQFADKKFVLNFSKPLNVIDVSRANLSYPFVRFSSEGNGIASKSIANEGKLVKTERKNNIEIQLPEKINNISVSIDGIGTIKYIVFNGSEADFYRFFIDNIDDKSSYSVAMAFLACAKLNDEKLFKTLKPYLANSKLTFQEFMKQAKENKVSDFKYALFSACHHIGSFNGHSFQYAKDGAENKIYLKQDAQTKKFSFAQFSLYSWIF
jgi:hypothetical protein